MAGVKSDVIAIWLAAVAGAVNVVFTFLGLYLVERIGRRPLMLSSMLGMEYYQLYYEAFRK